MSTEIWRTALGGNAMPSDDQINVITAPPVGRHSVDAGAGTGKTATLALRALYLIESESVRADQIVVVTFTKKAAAEIGSRIADTIDRAIGNGARFANDGRGVRCTTIHALASDIRREFAFDLGFEAPPAAVSDGEAHAIFNAAFRALLEDRLEADSSAFPLAEQSVSLLERDLGKLALRLKNHGISPDVFEARALAEADRFGRQSWGQLYAVRKTKPRADPQPTNAVTPAELAEEVAREIANIRLVATLLRDFDRRLRKVGAATYGDLIGDTTSLLKSRPAVVADLRARWRYVLLDESQDTSDLQVAFIEALFGKPGDPDAAGMMPVGDARQAIYGFNGADERVMQRLAEVADKTHPLVVNRRSYQEIVDVGHHVLKAAGVVEDQTPELTAHNGKGSIDCVRLENFGTSAQPIKERVELEGRAIAREIRRLLNEGRATTNEIAILVRRRTHANVYLRELSRQGIPAALDRRSSLLVADEIRDALAWMALLLDLGDRQAAVRVFQSPLCGLSDAAMIELAGSKDWLDQFLGGDDHLSSDGKTEPKLDVDTQLRLHRVCEMLVELLPCVALPLAAAMRRILTTLPIAASYVSLGKREGADMIGAQAIVNLGSFEVLTREFASQHAGARLSEFVADIDRRILYADDVQEAELDLDGVRILTIHQAKGLEWPYVFVACSTKAQYASSEPSDRVVNYDLASGAFALKNDIDGRETFRWLCLNHEHDPADGRRFEPSPRKQAAEREQARVFYVALTRAKKRVYVTAPAPAPDEKSTGYEAKFLQAIRSWANEEHANVDLGFDRQSTTVIQNGARARVGPQTLPRGAAPLANAASAFTPRISFTAISAFATCPRQARYRYRLLLPDLREARPRFVGLDSNETPLTTNAARLGSLVHRALELWGRPQIENRIAVPPIAYDEAFETARLEYDDVTSADADRAYESGKRAVEKLAAYTLLAVEEPFELLVGNTLVIGSVDLIARDPAAIVTVIDYKTGRAAGEKYALQLSLYRRVAEERYRGVPIGSAILRLTPQAAAFESSPPLAEDDVDRMVAGVDCFTSDEPNVGAWCEPCAYNGSGCDAPRYAHSIELDLATSAKLS
jgi:ATP-dependent exoDNAse (exonuclease V) beta subunit